MFYNSQLDRGEINYIECIQLLQFHNEKNICNICNINIERAFNQISIKIIRQLIVNIINYFILMINRKNIWCGHHTTFTFSFI